MFQGTVGGIIQPAAGAFFFAMRSSADAHRKFFSQVQTHVSIMFVLAKAQSPAIGMQRGLQDNRAAGWRYARSVSYVPCLGEVQCLPVSCVPFPPMKTAVQI